MSKPKPEVDIGVRRDQAKQGISLTSALLAFFVFYLAASVLNGRHLYEAASRRPFGPARTAWMTVTAPMNKIAVTLRLDRLRSWFEPLQNLERE